MLDTYEITKNTLAIIPIDSKRSEVIEDNDTFIINKCSTKIVDDS